MRSNKYRLINGWVNEWMNENTNEWVNKWMNENTTGWLNEWMRLQMDE